MPPATTTPEGSEPCNPLALWRITRFSPHPYPAHIGEYRGVRLWGLAHARGLHRFAAFSAGPSRWQLAPHAAGLGRESEPQPSLAHSGAPGPPWVYRSPARAAPHGLAHQHTDSSLRPNRATCGYSLDSALADVRHRVMTAADVLGHRPRTWSRPVLPRLLSLAHIAPIPAFPLLGPAIYHHLPQNEEKTPRDVIALAQLLGITNGGPHLTPRLLRRCYSRTLRGLSLMYPHYHVWPSCRAGRSMCVRHHDTAMAAWAAPDYLSPSAHRLELQR